MFAPICTRLSEYVGAFASTEFSFRLPMKKAHLKRRKVLFPQTLAETG